MRKLFAKAQDPISCETHALGAVAGVPAAIWFGKRIGQGTRASRK